MKSLGVHFPWALKSLYLWHYVCFMRYWGWWHRNLSTVCFLDFDISHSIHCMLVLWSTAKFHIFSLGVIQYNPCVLIPFDFLSFSLWSSFLGLRHLHRYEPLPPFEIICPTCIIWLEITVQVYNYLEANWST